MYIVQLPIARHHHPNVYGGHVCENYRARGSSCAFFVSKCSAVTIYFIRGYPCMITTQFSCIITRTSYMKRHNLSNRFSPACVDVAALSSYALKQRGTVASTMPENVLFPCILLIYRSLSGRPGRLPAHRTVTRSQAPLRQYC